MGALFTWLTSSRFALTVGKWAAIALTITLFLLSLRRSGERAGRLAERLENTEKANEIQRRMLKAAEEVKSLPEEAAVVDMLSDYAVMREQAGY